MREKHPAGPGTKARGSLDGERRCSVKGVMALAAALVFAASNPVVVDPSCEGHEEERCGGVDGPSAGGVAASADCTNFTFRLDGVSGGTEGKWGQAPFRVMIFA